MGCRCCHISGNIPTILFFSRFANKLKESYSCAASQFIYLWECSLKHDALCVNPMVSQSLSRSLFVFHVSSRAVGVPALSSRLLRLPDAFSSTLSGACSDWGGLAGARHARRCQPTGNHLHQLGWLHWSCPLVLWRAFSLTETILTCFC